MKRLSFTQIPSLALFNSDKNTVHSSNSIMINQNTNSSCCSHNIMLNYKILRNHCSASLDARNVTPRGTNTQVHCLSETVVGVLGGGQLGLMLCEAASPMEIKVVVLDLIENFPASNLCQDHMVGGYDDSATVIEFSKRCGVLTLEIEHVDAATLEKLEQGVDCQPKASTIRIIQDKYLQKVHFSRHAIPVPKFVQIDDFEGAERAGDLFGYPLMIKSKRLAYDGRGNAVSKNEGELSSAVGRFYYLYAVKFENMSCGDIPENTKCKLLHWCGDGFVAEGRISSTDLKVKVHHVPLVGSC